MAGPGVERALRTLQLAIRSEGSEDNDRRAWRTGQIPEDLQTEAARSMHLGTRECAALEEAIRWLAGDERFEYMDANQTDAAAWRFACQAALHRSDDHVKAFVAEQRGNQSNTRATSQSST